MQTATAALNDIQVRYCAHGSGPAVVFVHGLAQDHRSWQRQQEALTEHRTYAYDVRGHGSSKLGTANGTLEQLRDDLLAFLTEISGPAVCVGFSLGGTVVLSAAAQRPDLVTGAVVLGTSSVVGRRAAEMNMQRAAEVADPAALLETLRGDTRAMTTDSTVDIDELVTYRASTIGDGAGYANALTAMAGIRDNPLTPALAAVERPVTVIGAEHDAVCPRKAADILLAGLPRAHYVEIPNAGHLMNVDNPEAVTAALRTALADPA
ncbi:alpha/beta hydrolase [Saccharopolyspora sp. NPDC000359]|uniref:alpha/beta fold hydrolase n=1 Tax=Saccharopolyspora sp. NPDC000359 TaxID=3154251 RepID=UPI00332B35AA